MLKARQKIIQKNFVATFFVTLLLWSALALIFFFVPPEKPFMTEGLRFMPLVFLVLSFLALLFAGSLLFANTRRGFLLSLLIIIFMVLRYWEIGNYLNLLLLGGIFLSLEYYLSNKD